MTFVAVLPSIHTPWTRACLKTCALAPLVVDNTQQNRGVAASWNLGVDRLYEREADWLILISAAVRFGPWGGRDFVAHLEAAGDDTIALEADRGVGWHLIAFRRTVFDLVGRFDENFWPAYWEDNDFGWRIRCGFGLDPPYWRKVPTDVTDRGPGHGLNFVLNKAPSHARPDPEAQLDYYTLKWGSVPAHETFDRPFGGMPLAYWPQPVPSGQGGWTPNMGPVALPFNVQGSPTRDRFSPHPSVAVSRPSFRAALHPAS